MMMPRQGRERSKSGVYHVMVRGINRQDIFFDDEDRQQYMKILHRVKKSSGCELYAYCLMDNHVHLLIKEIVDDISQVMKRLGISYAQCYNRKYERCGHVFQDRYKSEVVEEDNNFLAVLRYIHQNPLRAGMAANLDDWSWSSHRLYATRKYQELVDIEFALGMFGKTEDSQILYYLQFMSEPNDIQYLDTDERFRRTDNEVRTALKQLMAGQSIHILSTMDRRERDEILKKLKGLDGISIRQIARVTGIGKNVAAKA
jgi:REP element-mobilizing transposase RayT